MRVYTRIQIDMSSGRVVDAQAYDYTGPVAHAGGGSGSSKAQAQPTYVMPGLLDSISRAADSSIIRPSMGDPYTVNWANVAGYQKAAGNDPFNMGWAETPGYTVPKSLTDINMDRAVQQVRGGYGARGLAGSGIAIGGEQNAIGQLALQGQQQNQTALTNLLAAGTGSSSTSKSSQPGGMSVVCTELHRQGLLDSETYAADCKFGLTLPHAVIRGYHFWAVPLARLMRRSRIATWLAYPIAHGWATEMRHRTVGDCPGSLVGNLLLRYGTPVCAWLGKERSWVTV